MLENTHVVLIALDGVRWQDVVVGVDRDLARARKVGSEHVVGPAELMPNLHALIAARGAAIGAPVAGRWPRAGRISCRYPATWRCCSAGAALHAEAISATPCASPRLLDELAALPGTGRGDVAVVASWEGVGRTIGTDDSRVIATVGRHLGRRREAFAYDAVSRELLRDGESAGPAPGGGDFRHDAVTAAIALRYFEKKKPNFYVRRARRNRRVRARQRLCQLSESAAQRRLGDRASSPDELFELERAGKRSILLVTTDHGRADGFTDHGVSNPESAFVWLVAVGDAIRARGFARAPEPRYLADIAPTLRAVLGLPHDAAVNAGQVMHELLLPNRSDPQRLAGSSVCLPCLGQQSGGKRRCPRCSETRLDPKALVKKARAHGCGSA